MLFSTPVFFFFFLPVLLLAYSLLRSNAARNTLLLAASIFFYFWGEVDRSWVLGAVVFASYYGSVLIEQTENPRKKLCLLIAFITLDSVFLLYFKYARFIALNIETAA